MTAANSATTSTPAETIAPALDAYFAPLRSRLAAIADMAEAEMVPALEALQKTLAAQLITDGIAPDAVAALQESLLREFVDGYARKPASTGSPAL